MRHLNFIKLKDCNGNKNLHISPDSIECIFSSESDYTGCRERGSYNFIKLKSGIIFETKEDPFSILSLIDKVQGIFTAVYRGE